MVLGGNKMPEFTQEQIDKMIEEKVSEAKKGLYDETELNKRITSEADRRVETGIQKGLETQKEKWTRELQEKAKLSADELAKKEYEEKLSGLTVKEKAIQKRANKIDAMDMLSGASIPKAQYEKVLNVLVTDDDVSTKENVNNFISMFNDAKSEIETRIKSEFSKVTSPKTGGEKSSSKEDFTKMGYREKAKFKTDFPDLYKEYIK